MNVRLTFLFIVGAVSLLPGCHRQVTDDTAGAEPRVVNGRVQFPDHSPALTSIKTATVELGAPAQSQLNGRIVWNDDVTARVFAPFAGRVERLLADVSEKVHAGQTLALIASPDFAQAQADAGKADADEMLAERNYQRLQALLEHGAAAQKDVQAAEADLARARAEKARAESTLRMRAGVNVGGEMLFPLNSNVGGEVVERNVSPGQEVRPDQMLANAPQFFAPLFVISDPTRLWVLIDATERELAGLHRGMTFTVHTSAFPEHNFTGEVEWIADELDPTTRMVKVRGSVANPDRLLKAEMFVTVEFQSNNTPQLEAPATAVFMKGDRHFAYVQERAGVFARREVQVGPQHDDRVQVTTGLRAGDRVVVEGALLLDEVFAEAGGA